MSKKLYSILIIPCLSSCYSYGPNSLWREAKQLQIHYLERSISLFFLGLQEKEFPSKGLGIKDIKIESKNGFLNYFARFYTLGIYWPRTLEIQFK